MKPEQHDHECERCTPAPAGSGPSPELVAAVNEGWRQLVDLRARQLRRRFRVIEGGANGSRS